MHVETRDYFCLKYIYSRSNLKELNFISICLFLEIKMADSDNAGLKKFGVGAAIVVGGLGLLLFIILFPMSFSYLDFYEVSFFSFLDLNL